MTFALVFSFAVGLAVGLLGGGGAILMVPILTIIAGWPASEAITVSLFVVGLTSLFSMTLHARRGNVRWRHGLVFGAIAMLGAYAGGLLSSHVPDNVLLTIFAAVMAASGIGMIRRRSENRVVVDSVPWARLISAALAIGVLSGLVGAGGGFLIVPALVLLLGFPMPAAVGTSLLVIAMQSASGFASHITHTHVQWPIVLAINAIALVGAVAGVWLGGRISAGQLRKGFGWFVIVMSGVMLARAVGAL